jgi:hypothetical protein
MVGGKIDLPETGIGWQSLRRAADKSENLKEAANAESRPPLMKPLPCKRLYTARAYDQRSCWFISPHWDCKPGLVHATHIRLDRPCEA